MSKKKVLSTFVGALIGFVMGAFFYIIPAKFLACGPLEIDGLFISGELQRRIMVESFSWGGGIGAGLGFFIGWSTPLSAPRGFMSKVISAFTLFPCLITGWVREWNNVYNMSSSRIVIVVLVSIFLIILAIPLSSVFVPLETIRE